MNLPLQPGLQRRLAYGEYIRNSSVHRVSSNTDDLYFNNVFGFNYEVLSQLQNVNKHSSIRDLLKFTELDIYKTKLKDIQLCVICQEIFRNEQIIRKLKCKHIFHAQCIEEWFCNSKKCPLCNTYLNKL